MLSQLFVFHKSKNFTSDYEIRMPPTVPVNHYSDRQGVSTLVERNKKIKKGEGSRTVRAAHARLIRGRTSGRSIFGAEDTSGITAGSYRCR